MALGWNTALALAAIELGIPLTAAVPFEGQKRKLADRATSVLACWNGSRGGTGICVTYARAHHVEIANLWGAWERYTYALAAARGFAENDGDERAQMRPNRDAGDVVAFVPHCGI